MISFIAKPTNRKIVMVKVHNESRFKTWTWLGIRVLFGVLLGAAGCYYFVQRDVARMADRLDSIQQMTPRRRS
jgi:hypothetical protein